MKYKLDQFPKQYQDQIRRKLETADNHTTIRAPNVEPHISDAPMAEKTAPRFDRPSGRSFVKTTGQGGELKEGRIMKRTVGLIEQDIAKINYSFTHHNNHPKMTIEKRRELMGKLNDLVMEKIGILHEEFLKEHKLSVSEAINS